MKLTCTFCDRPIHDLEKGILYTYRTLPIRCYTKRTQNQYNFLTVGYDSISHLIYFSKFGQFRPHITIRKKTKLVIKIEKPSKPIFNFPLLLKFFISDLLSIIRTTLLALVLLIRFFFRRFTSMLFIEKAGKNWKTSF